VFVSIVAFHYRSIFKTKANAIAKLLGGVEGVKVEINQGKPRRGAFVVKVRNRQ
jgi:hypothetical protein